MGALFDIACHFEVKPWVVHQYQRIGLPCFNFALATGHAAQNGAQVQGHLHKSHVGQLAIVAQEGAALGLHLFAAIIAELGTGALLLDGTHEVGRVQVATGLAGYDEEFH